MAEGKIKLNIEGEDVVFDMNEIMKFYSDEMYEDEKWWWNEFLFFFFDKVDEYLQVLGIYENMEEVEANGALENK